MAFPSFPEAISRLSSQTMKRIRKTVVKLYSFSLSNAREEYDDIMQLVETELGLHSVFVDALAKKLTFDLKNYKTYEYAEWFISERLGRVGEKHFGTLLNKRHVIPRDEKTFPALLNIARIERDSVKELLIMVLMVNELWDLKLYPAARNMLPDIERLSEKITDDVVSGNITSRDDWYLVNAYQELSFMSRNQSLGSSERFLKHAIQLNEKHCKDLGLSIRLQTYLINQLERGKTNMVSLNHYQKLLYSLQKALDDTRNIELLHGVKVFREAFLELSKYALRKNIKNASLNFPGRDIYKWISGLLGDRHHEVLLVASELALLLKQLGHTNDAKEYFEISMGYIDSIGEERKIELHAKIRINENLMFYLKDLRDLRRAEVFGNECVRLNKKCYGVSHQYVAEALRQLSFVVKDLGRRSEGRQILRQSLEMTKDCYPHFTSYIAMVEREFAKF